uniref:Uncharacterized protein n=1 Tax=Helianthus annuus TaxID=4232 RepID=A0A251T5E4_HELAN
MASSSSGKITISTSSTFSPSLGIELLSGANFATWRDTVKLTLGMVDLDYALRHDPPAALTTESTADQKIEHEK